MGRWWLAVLASQWLFTGCLATTTNSSVNGTATQCNVAYCDGIHTPCNSTVSALHLNARVTYAPPNASAALNASASPNASAALNASAPNASAAINVSWCLAQGAGFCPLVDQFAAINLLPLGAEFLLCSGMQIELFTLGNLSAELVLDTIPFTEDDVEGCPTLDALNISRRAFADMLVLNLTFNRGLWNYADVNGTQVLAGTGIQRTCGDDGVCQFDSTLPCIGGDKGKNGFCARCLTYEALMTGQMVHPSVYLAFYGTDGTNKRLLSGNQNPMNFRKYALGSVYNVVANATMTYIDKAINFDWGNLLNQTLSHLNLPDFESIWGNVVGQLTGGAAAGAGSAAAGAGSASELNRPPSPAGA